MNVISTPKLLVSASVVLLGLTAYSLASFGPLAYFVVFHKPFHLPQITRPAPAAPPLPGFTVTSAMSQTALTTGDSQTITFTATSNRTTPAYVEVWVESPANKQVFRSDTSGSPVQFVAGRAQTLHYSFTASGPKWPPGTYKIGEIITSTDNFTDYYVKPDSMRFTLS